MLFKPIANGKTFIRATSLRPIATEPNFFGLTGQFFVYNEYRSRSFILIITDGLRSQADRIYPY